MATAPRPPPCRWRRSTSCCMTLRPQPRWACRSCWWRFNRTCATLMCLQCRSATHAWQVSGCGSVGVWAHVAAALRLPPHTPFCSAVVLTTVARAPAHVPPPFPLLSAVLTTVNRCLPDSLITHHIQTLMPCSELLSKWEVLDVS
eukprot:365060-Chlamydomonas_euryale.AAC.2